MKTISAEQARANIIATYEKQHREGVNALSSAIERVKPTKATDTKKDATDSNAKPELLHLLTEAAKETEQDIERGLYSNRRIPTAL